MFLITYKKGMKDDVMKSLNHIHGWVTYDSEIIDLICYYSTADIKRIKNIIGVISVYDDADRVRR